MRKYKILSLFIVASFLFAKCDNRGKQPIVKVPAGISASDSISKLMMQTFGLPYSDNMVFDGSRCLL
jgi:hypothetical protein